MLDTELTRRWNLRIPIVQAPMAGVSGGALAGAVSAAGGLGMIGVAPATTVAWIAEQSAIARPHGPFGIGLMLWHERAAEQIAAALAERPFLVSLSFGDPAPYIERAHAAGALVAVQAQTAAAAQHAIEAGADAVVAQGTEAGGHTGAVGTLPLLQATLEQLDGRDTLVLAAGGIASGRAIAGVLAMGAHGAWVGTRFVASDEAMGSDAAKQSLVASTESDTVLTHVFDMVQDVAWPDEFPGRALRNDFTARWHRREGDLDAAMGTVRPAFDAARGAGDLREAHVYAGQAIGAIRDVRPAAELLQRMADEAETHLKRAARLTR